MKQGTTSTFKVKQFDLPDITEIIFSFTNDKNNVVVERTTPTTDDGQIHKSYPSEVSLEDGFYKIGLDQDETLKLNETFYVEAQIMFSGAVTKAYIDKVRMPHTFYTKVISGATTNGEEIELAMELSDVIEIEGGGSSNYNDLTNKPRINNTELIGNKTDTDLGLATKTELNAKQNTITGGNGIDVSSDVVSVDLKSSGSFLNFASGKLGVNTQSLGASQLREYLSDSSILSGFPTLATKTYVDNLISGRLKRLVVETLPTQDIDTNTIYMILKTAPTTNNIYDEYMYINNAWELIGSTEVDLSNYYTKTESDNRYNAKLTVGNGIDITNNEISAKVDGYNLYFANNNIAINTTNLGGSYSLRQELANGDSTTFALASKSNLADYQPKLTAGTNITIDANNVISASGSGGSYSAGNGIDITNDTISVDLKSGTELQITSGELDIDLSSYATTTDLSSKQDTIDSSHKLDADLVDDSTTTNKFVTSTEKSTWNGKEDKTTISTDTSSTTVSLTLADNHEYRYTQDLTSLTLTMPSGDFIASIVFASGSTPTSMTYDSSIKWSGNDVSSNAFVPQANQEYEIVFWYNGLSINAVVRGVA